MDKLELATMLEVVRKDLYRHGREDSLQVALATACIFAIWHLRGEPSFVQRNDAMRDNDRAQQLADRINNGLT